MANQRDFPRRDARPRTIVRRPRPSVGERRVVTRPAQRRGVEQPREAIDFTNALSLQMPRRWLLVACLISAFAVLAGAGVFALRSDIFTVRELQVRGNSRVAAEDVLTKAGLSGTSMFTVNLGDAEKRIARLPFVKSATIAKHWPASVTINIVERTIWGTWEQGGVRYAIDRDGIVLSTSQPAPGGAPVIQSSEPGSRQEGDHVDYQAVAAAAEIYEELPAALGVQVAQVAFTASKGVQVTTTDGQIAVFGDSSSIAYKLAVWAATQKAAQGQGIKYTSIDLRFGNRPVLQ